MHSSVMSTADSDKANERGIKSLLEGGPKQPFGITSACLEVFQSSRQRRQGGRGQHPPSWMCCGDGTWILVSTALVMPGSPPTAVAFPSGKGETHSEKQVTLCPANRSMSVLTAPLQAQAP